MERFIGTPVERISAWISSQRECGSVRLKGAAPGRTKGCSPRRRCANLRGRLRNRSSGPSPAALDDEESGIARPVVPFGGRSRWRYCNRADCRLLQVLWLRIVRQVLSASLSQHRRRTDVREDGSHININETIDANVFKRWRADPRYRPANLVEWAQRKKVDPAQLQTSVRADDPDVGVPDP
jgi:hypothetical protein